MSGTLSGVAVVTGAARGIGLATARQAAADGASVVLLDKDEAEVTKAAESLCEEGFKARAMAVDLSDLDAATAAVEDLLAADGDIRYWVNNASLGPTGGSESFAEGVHGSLVITGALSRVVAPVLAERGGAIVNVSSLAAFTASGSDWYSAGKAGVLGLTREHAVRYGPGVRINAVTPGIVVTGRTARFADDPTTRGAIESRLPLRRLGEPADIASVVCFLLGPAAAYVTGSTIVVDGGLSVVGL